jgi:hypothetical protein
MLNQYRPTKSFTRWPTPPVARWWERLSRGPASVTDLATPLAIALSAVVQHLQVLE